MMKNILQLIAVIFCICYSAYSDAKTIVNLCMTGKVEDFLPAYKTAFMNAVNLALSESPTNIKNKIKVKTYFYDGNPLSPIKAYDQMIFDHCSAIIGYEYLTDLMLVEKMQQNTETPIFTSYASSSDTDFIPKNVFIFSPSYEYQAKKMVSFLETKFGKLKNILIITEVNRVSLNKYKTAYADLLVKKGIRYNQFDFLQNDKNLEIKLKKFIENKHYNYVFVFSGAVGSSKIVNLMNDHKTIFIGTENFGSSTNQSLFVRLRDKNVRAYVIRNIDMLKRDKMLTQFYLNYTKQFLSSPSPLSAYTYDAVNILLKTLLDKGSLNINNIFRVNYHGITGVTIENGKFNRSNKFVILSIKPSGYIYEK